MRLDSETSEQHPLFVLRGGSSFLLLLSLSITGCSDDENMQPPQSSRDASLSITSLSSETDAGIVTHTAGNDALTDTRAPDLGYLQNTAEMTGGTDTTADADGTTVDDTRPEDENPQGQGATNGAPSTPGDDADVDGMNGFTDNTVPLPTLGLNVDCDLEDALRYENFVLANNCPGPCCWEFPGDQLSDDRKRSDWIEPRIHSAYHDRPTQVLKSDVPPPAEGLNFYVPLAKFGIDAHLTPSTVACRSDQDCLNVGDALRATCSRQDGDGDGERYADAASTEYLACIQDVDCASDGGIGGDLATQSAVPESKISELCNALSAPDDSDCDDAVSACVYSPAWVSQPPEHAPEDFRAPAVVRPAGQLFIQGVNLIDTEMEAHFVRVRSSSRNGPETPFRRMVSDPVSGDVVVELRNGGQCVMTADERSDCHARTPSGHLQYAVQPNTVTRGSGAAHTREAADAIEPMFWYLERENQWLRYHQRLMDGDDVDFGFAELYDDLVIASVPESLAPGLYAVQLSYSANTWLASIEQTFGRLNACLSRSTLQERCLSAFDNPRLAAQQCEQLIVDCEDDEQSIFFERDRKFLTNPIYVQIAPNQVEQTYRISVDAIRAIQSGEYGPGAYGPRDRADIWVSDDVNLFSMVVRFDPSRLDEQTTCSVGPQGERPANSVCSVDGPWFTYLEDIEPGRNHDLRAAGFSADVSVRPGEVVNIVTFAFDTDGRGGGSQTSDILQASGSILGGVAQIVAGAYGAPGIGQGVAGAIGGMFGLTDSVIGGLNDPELIALTVTSYTAQELALMTLAAQMGLTPEQLRETNVGPLRAKPLFETHFQGFDYDMTETIHMPDQLSWGKHHETRRIETRAPDAEEIGCIREHLLNSCAYRGHSTYEFDYTIEHIRDE